MDDDKDPNSDGYLNLLATHGLPLVHNYPIHDASFVDHMFIKSKYSLTSA